MLKSLILHLECLLMFIVAVSVSSLDIRPQSVFTLYEQSQCGYLLRSAAAVTLPNGTIFAVVQCRKYSDRGTRNVLPESIGDDFTQGLLVAKVTHNFGETWSPMRIVTPLSTSTGSVVYHAPSDQLVAQYGVYTGSDPYKGQSIMQCTPHLDVTPWPRPRINVTKFLLHASNPEPITGPPSTCAAAIASKGDINGGAGNRIVLTKGKYAGRIIFSGHNQNYICVWWSDDAGATWTVGPPLIGDENSLVELSDGSVYMSTRGLGMPWHSAVNWHRGKYLSRDGGATWMGPVEDSLVDNSEFGCEAGMTSLAPSKDTTGDCWRILFSEPVGPMLRVSYRLHCSSDDGLTWKYETVNQLQSAGYSYLVPGPNSTSVVGLWEHGTGGTLNIVSHVFDVSWCTCV